MSILKRYADKYKMSKRLVSALLSAALVIQPAASSMLSRAGFIPVIEAFADSWTGTVTADKLNVRGGAGTSFGTVGTLFGQSNVTVLGSTTGTDGKTWYQISFNGGTVGFVRSDYIKQAVVYSASDGDFEQWMNSQGFPESYKNGLRGLHQQYPNWVFKAQQTGLDWNTVINEESKIGRNLVQNTSISSWKSIESGGFDWASNYWPSFDGTAWNAASRGIIEYYMDPRNFLVEPYIFQFELQSYDASTQTREGLAKLVEGTFLSGNVTVPIEGSQVDAGTPIADSSSDSGNGSSVSGNSGSSSIGPGSSVSSSGSSSIGPGSSGSSSDSSSIGPGTRYNGSSDSSASASGSSDSTDSSSGPGSADASANSVISAGPGALSIVSNVGRKFTAISGLYTKLANFKGFAGLSNFANLLGMGSIKAYADTWQKNENSVWFCYKDNGDLYTDGWYWIDGNKDGTAECYYFYTDGSMAASCDVEGYHINADGQWVDDAGGKYTKNVGGSSGPGSSSGSSASDAGTGSDGSVSSENVSYTMKSVSYVDIIMKAAEVSGVSPYVLASMILQEQGKGTSDSISGTNSKYPGVYNYYNLNAYEHDGMGPVEAGLNYASQSGNGDRPWNTIEKSIIGGAKAYGANYVNAGQDTFYLKKYNVQGSNIYNHQYMTNVPAAASEGAKISDAYNADIKSTGLVFKIPVYNNMPEAACQIPSVDGNPNNKLRSISVEGFSITPTFSMDTTDYTLIVDAGVTAVNINTETIDSGASVSGAGSVALNTGVNQITITVTAANGSQRNYNLSITRREGEAGAVYDGSTAIGPGSDANAAYTDSSSIQGIGPGMSAAQPIGPGSAYTDQTADQTSSADASADTSADTASASGSTDNGGADGGSGADTQAAGPGGSGEGVVSIGMAPQ